MHRRLAALVRLMVALPLVPALFVAVEVAAEPKARGTSTSASASLPALSEATRAAISRVRADPRVKLDGLTQQTHYLISDERRHDHFRGDVKNLGGAYVGVGSNQSYDIAGWARSELVVLIDFDQVVINLHKLYTTAFLQAATPEAFLKLWSKDGAPRFIAVLKDKHEGKRWATEHALWTHRFSRRKVYRGLLRAQRRYRGLGVPSFLTDQKHYDHIVALQRAGRVFAFRADLTGKVAMRDLAFALKRAGQTVRVLYLSNCEFYFDYTKEFRRNMLRIPGDARSVVLRTRPWRAYKEGGGMGPLNYLYVAQALDNFHRWMRYPRIKNARKLVPAKLLKRPEAPHFVVTAEPHRAAKARATNRTN